MNYRIKKYVVIPFFLAGFFITLIYAGSAVFKYHGEPKAIFLFLFTVGNWLLLGTLLIDEFRRSEKFQNTDFLVGGYNLRGFIKNGNKILKKAEADDYAVLDFNIRGFKEIDQQIGESEADYLLYSVHSTMKSALKKGEICCRSEMDRFLILLRESSEQRIEEFAKKLIKHINEKNANHDLHFQIGVSWVREKKTLKSAIYQANLARENSQYQDRCFFYTQEMEDRLRMDSELLKGFEESIERHDFIVYLQPVVPLHENNGLQAEALVRWNHPKLGMIGPDQFIKLLEKNNKIMQLDLYMFEEVCRILHNLRERENSQLTISVNLSRNFLKRQGQQICSLYRDIKQRYQIPDGMIKLELTEDSMFAFEDLKEIRKILDGFHQIGIAVGLDDFGFAYSALALLKELNIDFLKLDRTFFINENWRSHIIVSQLIQLAHALGFIVVAEGIEVHSQVKTLTMMECDYIQGYYFSKPVTVDEFFDQRNFYGTKKY